MTSKRDISPLWALLRKLLRAEGIDADALSVAKLCKTLGIGHGSVQRIQEGHMNLTALTVSRLAERFNVPPSFIGDAIAGVATHDDLAMVRAANDLEATMSRVKASDFSPLALHLAMTIDEVKGAELKTKAFAAAVVAIQNAIGQTGGGDKSQPPKG